MLSELDARKGLLVLFLAPTAWLLVAWIGGYRGSSAPGECPEWTDSGSSQSQLSDPLTVVLLTWTVSTPWRAPSQRPNSSFSSAYTTDGCFPWPLLCSCCWQSGSQCPRSLCMARGNTAWRTTSLSRRLCAATASLTKSKPWLWGRALFQVCFFLG